MLFIILALLQLGALAVVFAMAVELRPGALYALEALAVADVAFLIFFYRRTLRPINRLAGGLDLLRAQDWNTRLRHVGQPEVDAIADVFNDMLERLKNQRIRYRERTHLLNLLVEAAPVGVVILGFDGRAALVNPAARAMLDADAALGPFLDGLGVGGSDDLTTASGETLRCSCRSFVDRGVSHRFYIVENISNSVATAERAAYEKVIRIIAHEVNNTVAGLSSAFDAVIPLMQAEPDLAAVLSSCSERSAALSTFITRFAEVVRLPEPTLVRQNVNDILTRCTPFLQSLGAPCGVPVEIECGAGVPDADIDAAQFEQVLVNIVKNAVESVVAAGAGAVPVRIATSAADGHAVVEVTDRGTGISAEKSRKIFTPFYTDKPMGQGVGLTLVRDILRHHSARFSLSTSEGVTTFRIEFA